jgi:hypothetical protein
LIITKDAGASLARDVSHSRPHRVADTNDFDVFGQLGVASGKLKKRLEQMPRARRPVIRNGDARALPWVRDRSVDMILTSPPYLNAIDYMRGHRLSLVWQGYSLATLRNIRSNSIGAERAPDTYGDADGVLKIQRSLGKLDQLPDRYKQMTARYCMDLILLAKQSARVLKKSGRAVFVIGNSCLRDVFVSNSRAFEMAAEMAGLQLIEKKQRKLPDRSRYLPLPKSNRTALGRRMRIETVLTFAHQKTT